MRRHTAYVFDLDGVVRDFAPGDANAAIEAALGLPAGHVAATAFRPDLLLPTITGRQTFDEWYAAICLALGPAVPEPARAARIDEHMEAWRAHRGTPVEETVERLRSLRADGHRTYVFTNGTDLVPQELELLGLARLFDGLLNSADFGVAKPDPAAYAAAHRVIESDLGRRVDRADVWFTDDRQDNVDAACEFGWEAVLFTRTTNVGQPA
ncbi:hydrolase [Intrasporangium oryzae NRRL B-24470]|uniref:Hydrolase n=1 Tax=Intrasporangium oryzae NRRL B-24470 TaxID=1386089 RepID=W9G7J0_9MICO|nr:HAD family hydrolase [Intrasporangium oryzae]EWT01247.1 hydrolase [Intrasporangium oryzae NRRL B-24470]